MFDKLTLNDPVFNVPGTHLNPPCKGGLGNSIDNEVYSYHYRYYYYHSPSGSDGK